MMKSIRTPLALVAAVLLVTSLLPAQAVAAGGVAADEDGTAIRGEYNYNLNKQSVQTGEEIRVDVNVYNPGTATISRDIVVYQDGDEAARQSISVNAGEQVETTPLYVSYEDAGDHSLQVQIRGEDPDAASEKVYDESANYNVKVGSVESESASDTSATIKDKASGKAEDSVTRVRRFKGGAPFDSSLEAGLIPPIENTESGLSLDVGAGDITDFTNAKQPGISTATIEPDPVSETFNVGFELRDISTGDRQTLVFRYSADLEPEQTVTGQIVKANGDPIAGDDTRFVLSDTNGQLSDAAITLKASEVSHINANNKLYVTLSGTNDAQMELACAAIATNSPAPSTACRGAQVGDSGYLYMDYTVTKDSVYEGEPTDATAIVTNTDSNSPHTFTLKLQKDGSTVSKEEVTVAPGEKKRLDRKAVYETPSSRTEHSVTFNGLEPTEIVVSDGDGIQNDETVDYTLESVDYDTSYAGNEHPYTEDLETDIRVSNSEQRDGKIILRLQKDGMTVVRKTVTVQAGQDTRTTMTLSHTEIPNEQATYTLSVNGQSAESVEFVERAPWRNGNGNGNGNGLPFDDSLPF